MVDILQQTVAPTTQTTVLPQTTVVEYAGFGLRVLAVIIDGFIIFIPALIVIFVLTLVFGQAFKMFSNILSFLIDATYFVLLQSKNGQTPGKKIMKIKVVDAQGQVPTTGKLILREVIGKLVDGFILGIGFLWPIWDKRKQALHDKIAGTFVIKVNS